MANVKFITKIGVTDPETNEEYWLDIFLDPTGKVIGLDSVFLATTDPDVPVKSPYGNEDIFIDE